MPGIDDDRTALTGRLREAGLTQRHIDEAEAEGRLPTLAVEVALGGQGQHTLTAVAKSAGIDPKFLREVMQAAGRPNPGPRERVFTDEDKELAKLLSLFVKAGLPRAELLEVTRVLSHGMAQTADAVRGMVGNALLHPGDSEQIVGLRYAQAVDQLGPLVPTLLAYQFRAQLRDGIRRELVTEAERESGSLAGTRDVAVAFADLVDYTSLGEKLAPEDLGAVASRLSQLSFKAVRRPVQVVKLIGDAAMFVSPDADALVSALTRLVTAVQAEGKEFPHLRVGGSFGPATARSGDWFGKTVNVASRVTGLAKPGQVVVTEALADAAAAHEFKRRKRKRALKGVDGRVRLFDLVDAPAG